MTKAKFQFVICGEELESVGQYKYLGVNFSNYAKFSVAEKNLSLKASRALFLIKQEKFDKVSKGAKMRNRYNQVPHLTLDNNGKVTNSQLDTTNESQEVNPFPAGDHKAHINRHIKT